jgi:choline-glycine betaine transporter
VVFAISLLLAGAMGALQGAIMLFALRFALAMVRMVALWRALRADALEEGRRERERPRRLRKMAARQA